ncbi:dTMP kinase [Coleofasciculus sp. FACHB-T130]|uniref:dTMP kinase n=1 Tax=Cyanophyceae TaxID=3028117 RepID=UPI00168824CB|nr:dTMP kinase [Coleofasciculus sp. FACHB-T130]MBD1879993.1 dTMP kinase [Coleofasciculus sp. FACHB-T130]
MQGKLIVFEGVEGSGKTTQMQRSRDWLLERMKAESPIFSQVAITREPGGTELGKALRRLLLEGTLNHPIQDRTELLLYAADRSQHVEEVLKPTLAAGGIILCDRYTDSTIAYQGYGRGLSLSLIKKICQMATDGLESDLTLWLDVDVEIGLARAKARGAADRMEQAELAFHQRVQQGFRALAAAHPQRIVRVDGSGTEAEVQGKIQAILTQRFREWSLEN